jgi:uncharacterized protein YodC (DUF2158 family)
MDELKKGDEVRLKSGGPVMTVRTLGNYTMSAGISDGVLCVWFEGNKVQEKVFDRATLVKHKG